MEYEEVDAAIPNPEVRANIFVLADDIVKEPSKKQVVRDAGFTDENGRHVHIVRSHGPNAVISVDERKPIEIKGKNLQQHTTYTLHRNPSVKGFIAEREILEVPEVGKPYPIASIPEFDGYTVIEADESSWTHFTDLLYELKDHEEAKAAKSKGGVRRALAKAAGTLLGRK